MYPFYSLSCHTHKLSMLAFFSHPSQRCVNTIWGRVASATCSKRTWCSHFWYPPVRSTWPPKLSHGSRLQLVRVSWWHWGAHDPENWWHCPDAMTAVPLGGWDLHESSHWVTCAMRENGCCWSSVWWLSNGGVKPGQPLEREPRLKNLQYVCNCLYTSVIPWCSNRFLLWLLGGYGFCQCFWRSSGPGFLQAGRRWEVGPRCKGLAPGASAADLCSSVTCVWGAEAKRVLDTCHDWCSGQRIKDLWISWNIIYKEAFVTETVPTCSEAVAGRVLHWTILQRSNKL